jgi:hypothetical protein
VNPLQGMSRSECDALLRDLVAGGIEVVRVEEPAPGMYRLYCHCPMPDHNYWITHAARFRQSVRAGLVEGIPRNALGGAH